MKKSVSGWLILSAFFVLIVGSFIEFRSKAFGIGSSFPPPIDVTSSTQTKKGGLLIEGSLSVGSSITATSYAGDGSALTGIASGGLPLAGGATNYLKEIVGAVRTTHTFVNDFIFNTPQVIRSTHIATLLPLQEGASNYLIRVTSGTEYQMKASTINIGGIQVSSITISSTAVFQREVTFGTRRFILPDSLGTNGQVLETDGGGNLSWATDDSGGTTSTTTLSFFIPGDMFLATNTFSPVNVSFAVNETTFNITSMRARLTYKASLTATMFRFAESTATTGGHDNWAYISPQVVVSTDNNWSTKISTEWAAQPNKTYAAHITTAGVDGTIASQAEIYLKGWYVTPTQ